MKKSCSERFFWNASCALKGAKVLTSIALANLFIGFVVPKMNHYITNTLRSKQTKYR